ncbi:vacuolar protein-sorting-associated protein 36-like [Palaemon carinicauda]|uniref:vacuolar protein-sorting-associated protein 36-like n=1 Tax=Palaemon carinicauda TaxID=392227 RepID=UPI0035B58236
MTWPGPQQQQPWQPPQQQQFWHPPQPATSQEPPEQQQQHRPASHPSWMPPQSPHNIFIVVAVSHIQDTSDTNQLPAPDPGSVDSNLEEGMSPSPLYTSKELNTLPVQEASSPRSGKRTETEMRCNTC